MPQEITKAECIGWLCNQESHIKTFVETCSVVSSRFPSTKDQMPKAAKELRVIRKILQLISD
jgi:hypothetical protein